MKISLFATGLFSLLVLLSGCSRPNEQRYFPLREGDVREYSVVGSILDKSGQRRVVKEDSLTCRNEGVAHINGLVYHKQVATFSDTNYAAQIECMRIDKHGVHIIDAKDDSKREHSLIPFPLQIGNSWTAKRAGVEYKYHAETIETLRVSDKEFAACLKLSCTPTNRDATGHTKGCLYYAPNIGHIKEVLTFDNGLSITVVLRRLNSVPVCGSEMPSDGQDRLLEQDREKVADSRMEARASSVRRPLVDTTRGNAALDCSTAFSNYLAVISANTPTKAFNQTLDCARMVHKVSEKYPKTMWEEKFEQAAKEITSDPDFSMPLSDWVSEKYSGLQYEIIEVREIPEQETTIRFMLESPLRERISKGFSVFFKVSYSNPNAPILNRRTVNEVLCKVEVYRLIHFADDINILVDRDSLKIIETKFEK